MSTDAWKKHPDGSFAVNPTTGWSTATFMKGMAGGLRLEYALDPSLTKRDAVQLILTAAQVTELRKALQVIRPQFAQ